MEVLATGCPQKEKEKETQIATQIDNLHAMINENMLLQNRIFARINPCMRESEPDEEPSNECPRQQLCPLADTIRLAVDKLEKLVSEKNDMLDRLEI